MNTEKPNKGGMKAADGAEYLRRKSANLDEQTIREAKRLGRGNLSLGLREAVRLATLEARKNESV